MGLWGEFDPIKMRKQADKTGSDQPALVLGLLILTALVMTIVAGLLPENLPVWKAILIILVPLIIGVVIIRLTYTFNWGARKDGKPPTKGNPK
jgi:uncharacterized membrane protein